MTPKQWYTGCSSKELWGIQFASKTFLHQPHVGFDGAGYERSDETYHRQSCSHNAALSPRVSYSFARCDRGSLHGNRHCDRELGAKAALVSKFHGRHFSVPSPKISSIIIQAGRPPIMRFTSGENGVSAASDQTKIVLRSQSASSIDSTAGFTNHWAPVVGTSRRLSRRLSHR